MSHGLHLIGPRGDFEPGRDRVVDDPAVNPADPTPFRTTFPEGGFADEDRRIRGEMLDRHAVDVGDLPLEEDVAVSPDQRAGAHDV